LKELKKQDSSAESVKHLVTLKEGVVDIRINKSSGIPSFWKQDRIAKLKASVLAFYNQEEGRISSVDGAIVLDNFSFQKLASDGGGLLNSSKTNCLELINHSDEGRKYNLCTASSTELEEWLKALQETKSNIANIKVLKLSFPDYWHPGTDSYRRIPIQQGSKEWRWIETKLQQSVTKAHRQQGGYKNFEIVSIHRVQNPTMWTQYFFTRERIALENGGVSNERFLFHGTSSSTASVIIKEGFDVRVAALTGMFGAGIYFAENSSKSDLYTGSSVTKTLILCRATLGNQYVTLSSMTNLRRPPDGNGLLTRKKYHSVVGDSQKYNPSASLKNREFIVYDNSQAYPEYIIEYKHT